MQGQQEAEKRIQEVGQVGGLYLSLKGLTLKHLPEALWHLTQLEMLHLQENALAKLSSGIGQLKNLQVLNLSGNPLTELPPEIGNLREIHSMTVGLGVGFNGLPAEFDRLVALSHIEFSGGSIDTWIAALGQLPNLKYVTLKRCDLQDIRGLRTCKRLSSLAFIDCTLNNNTFDQLAELKTLDELVIDAAHPPLEAVPESIGKLSWLKNLVIKSPRLASVPDSIGNLNKLRVLHIHAGEALRELPNALGELNSLLELNVNHANLSKLPDTIGNLKHLQQMRVQNSSLGSLPESIGLCRNLRDLRVSRNALETIPESIARCDDLRYLCLDNNLLRFLPSSLAQMARLAYITVEDNPNLSDLPDGIRVSNYVEIGGTGIERLPDSLREARVDIYGESVDATPYFSPIAASTDDDVWSYANGSLRITGDTPSRRLEESLPKLREDVIELSFEEIDVTEPTLDVAQFKNLEKLIFGVIHYGSDTPFILPSDVRRLSKLRDLEVLSTRLQLPAEIGYWQSLENILAENAQIDFPEKLAGGNLGSLRIFSIGLGSKLERLPDWFGACPKLNIIRLHECMALRHLPESFTDHHMEELSIFQCPDIEYLPDGMTLTRLLIRKENQVMAFPKETVITGYLDASGLDGVRIPDNFKRLRLEDAGYRDLQSIYIDPYHLTPIAVLTETTKEIQRAQIGAVGLERFLEVLNTDVIDEDMFEGKLRRVLRVKLAGEDPVIAVEIRDELGSTFRVLAPDMQPPANAQFN